MRLRLIAGAIAAVAAARADSWTAPIEACQAPERCVSYRARLSGEYLIVEASHQPGWHTIAMDNKRRADEKLAGRPSLGVDTPTDIRIGNGLALAGSWLQSPPKDASKPDLLWFTWVFEKQALFAARVRRTGNGPARIEISGQACTETTCKKVDLAISLPLTNAPAEVDLKPLVPVR